MSTTPQPVDSFQDFPYEVCTDLLPSLCVLYLPPILIYHWGFSVCVYEVSNSLAGQNDQLILLMSGKKMNAACLQEISVQEVHRFSKIQESSRNSRRYKVDDIRQVS